MPRAALRNAFIPGGTATHMRVIAPELRRGKGVQLTLFDEPKTKLDGLAVAKEAINTRYGRFKVRSGATLHLPKVYRDTACNYDTCEVRGKVCF